MLETIDAEKQVGWWLYKMTKATYIGRAESRDLGHIFGGFLAALGAPQSLTCNTSILDSDPGSRKKICI